jgi:hypothetical protein
MNGASLSADRGETPDPRRLAGLLRHGRERPGKGSGQRGQHKPAAFHLSISLALKLCAALRRARGRKA